MKALRLFALSLSVSSFTLAQQSGTTPAQTPIAGDAILGVDMKELAMIATGHRATKLIGEPVHNDRNEKLGKLEDLIVLPDGKLSYGIIEVGGFLGMRDHRVAIPIGQFTVIQPRLVLPGATKEVLKALPRFSYAPEKRG